MGNMTATAAAFALVAMYFIFHDDTRFDPETMKNRRVLVTGASSGIGEQLAYQYAKLGARLVITARRQDLLKQVGAKCKLLGAAQIETLPADMKLSKDRESVIRETEARLGGLDILILNHAVLRGSKFWLGTESNATVLNEDMEVNFVSFVDLTSRAIQMLTESKGQIGVVSSECGILSCPSFSPYSASKFALHGFFSSLRQEFIFHKRNVTVTMCVLGLIATDNALKKIQETLPHFDTSIAVPAEDCADAIVKAVAAGKYTMHFPTSTYYLDWARRLLPEYVENYMGRDLLKAKLK